MRARSALLLAWLAAAAPGAASAEPEGGEPEVALHGDGVRVFADGARGAVPLASSASDARQLDLVALRDEVVAFQVVARAGSAPLGHVEVRVTEAPGVRVERFLERFVPIRSRSRNEHEPHASLAFTPAARPADAAVLGAAADPLVPLARPPGGPGAPHVGSEADGYPLHLAPGEVGAVWVDLHVAADAAPGPRALTVEVLAAGERLAAFPVSVDVRKPVVPWGAARFFAYYDFETELARRMGDAETAERSLLRALHAHHVEPLVSLRARLDVERVRGALDGSLYAREAGYDGPGAGLGATVAAIGAYGALGDPAPHKIPRVRAIADAVPSGVHDLFLYAVDEQCASPRGPAWRALLDDAGLARVLVGHTCASDPRAQPVDVVMTPAETFRRATARAARAAGKRVWVYNGRAPWSGTFALDLPVTALRASAWLAAWYDVDRWFLWETTFWNNDNAGGRGEIDPFAETETFHNADGDAVLGDGLLLYPGREIGTFRARSLGRPEVLPSVRLKNLRRGIQDAGIYALARAARPEEADPIVRAVLRRGLDEVSGEEPTAFPAGPEPWDDARRALLALIPDDAALDGRAAARALFDAAAARPAPPASPSSAVRARVAAALSLGALVVVLALGLRPRRRRTA